MLTVERFKEILHEFQEDSFPEENKLKKFANDFFSEKVNDDQVFHRAEELFSSRSWRPQERDLFYKKLAEGVCQCDFSTKPPIDSFAKRATLNFSDGEKLEMNHANLLFYGKYFREKTSFQINEYTRSQFETLDFSDPEKWLESRNRLEFFECDRILSYLPVLPEFSSAKEMIEFVGKHKLKTLNLSGFDEYPKGEVEKLTSVENAIAPSNPRQAIQFLDELRELPQLKTLKVITKGKYREMQGALEELFRHGKCSKTLTMVDLTGSDLSEPQLRFLPCLEKLQELNLTDCNGLGSEEMDVLSRCPNLKKLNISQLRNEIIQSDFVPESLEKLTQIKVLDISRMEVSTQKVLPHITVSLKELNFSYNCDVDCSDLERFTGLENLFLEGTGCFNVISMNSLTMLRSLSLWGLSTSFLDCSEFTQLKQLKTLKLTSSNGISNVSSLLKLPLKRLGLFAEFKIDNLEVLAKHPHLEFLNFSSKESEELVQKLEASGITVNQ